MGELLKVIIIESASKHMDKDYLIKSRSETDGCDCWGNYYYKTDYFVYINDKCEYVSENMFIAHDGEKVYASLFDFQLDNRVEYQEQATAFNYGWTPSTKKDFNNPKKGFEYRMIYKI